MGYPGQDPVVAPGLARPGCGSTIWAAGWRTSSTGCWKTTTVGGNRGSSPARLLPSPLCRRAAGASRWRRSPGAGPRLRPSRCPPLLRPQTIRAGRRTTASPSTAGSAAPLRCRRRLRRPHPVLRAVVLCRVPPVADSIERRGGCVPAPPPGSCSRWCAARHSPVPPVHPAAPPPSDRRWC